jgi:DNA repair exonuclease SbcCD ATPase subunit
MAGSFFTFGLFYFGVARPASDELIAVKQQIEAMERSVAIVAGHKGSVDETNHLLNLLGQQQAYAKSARKVFAELQKLNSDLIGESHRVDEALLAIDQLASIKDLALANSDRTAEAAEALNASEQLQTRLADSAETTEQALRAGIDLLAIQNELNRNADQNESARASLHTLIELRTTISAESSDLSVAEERVSDLVALKNSVLAGTTDLKDSIETLQLTRELQDRYQDASQFFREMRSWMMEMAAMQPVFSKVQSAVQPLTDLVNLERMQPQQLREFAKVYTQQSKTRLAGLPSSGSASDANSVGSPKDSIKAID